MFCLFLAVTREMHHSVNKLSTYPQPWLTINLIVDIKNTLGYFAKLKVQFTFSVNIFHVNTNIKVLQYDQKQFLFF